MSDLSTTYEYIDVTRDMPPTSLELLGNILPVYRF